MRAPVLLAAVVATLSALRVVAARAEESSCANSAGVASPDFAVLARPLRGLRARHVGAPAGLLPVEPAL